MHFEEINRIQIVTVGSLMMAFTDDCKFIGAAIFSVAEGHMQGLTPVDILKRAASSQSVRKKRQRKEVSYLAGAKIADQILQGMTFAEIGRQTGKTATAITRSYRRYLKVSQENV